MLQNGDDVMRGNKGLLLERCDSAKSPDAIHFVNTAAGGFFEDYYHKYSIHMDGGISLRDLLTRVNDYIAASRNRIGDDQTIEFELRTGNISPSTYRASLAAAHCDQSATRELSLSIYEYERGTKNASLVTRKTYVSPIDKGSPATTIRKTPIAHVRHSQPCDIKFALTMEEQQHSGPAPQRTSVARLRIRTSRRVQIAQHTWSLDITLVLETTYGDLQADRSIREMFFTREDGIKTHPIHYEVELELLLPRDQPFVPLQESDMQLAADMICDIAYPVGIDIGAAQSPRDLLTRLIARKLNKKPAALNSLLNGAKSMTKTVYLREVYQSPEFFITDKTDGTRAVAVITIERAIGVVTAENAIGDPAALAISTPESIFAMYDGELVMSPTSAVFYAFDCLVTDGMLVTGETFSSRIHLIKEFTTTIDNITLSIRLKKFSSTRAADIRELVTSHISPGDYKTDGLIFTRDGKSYYETDNWKWKSYEDTTIDFLCLSCPESMIDRAPFIIPRDVTLHGTKAAPAVKFYILMCSCSDSQRRALCIRKLAKHDEMTPPEMRNNLSHFVCPFEPLAYVLIVRPSDIEQWGGDLHNKVMEMRWRDQSAAIPDPWRHWDLMRHRTDKIIGNNILTAINVFANYIDPFPVEALWNPTVGYFEQETESRTFTSKKYRRFILTILLHQRLNGHAVIEFGGGRAQDFTRYAAAGADIVLNYDSDPVAIVEGVERVESINTHIDRSAAYKWIASIGEKPRAGTQRAICAAPAYIGRVSDITTLTPDALRADFAAIGIPPHSFSSVVSTFAFHYFCTDRVTVTRVFELASAALAEDGTILITTMNGAEVHNRLKASGGVYELNDEEDHATEEHSRAKYRIEAAYPITEEFREFGQMIRVSVPFSERMYDEPLCNFDAIATIAESCGFVRQGSIRFSDTFLPAWNTATNIRLTHADREYTALFEMLIFARHSARIVPAPTRSTSRALKKKGTARQ